MPERATLAAVLFDAGGTLVRLDFEWMAEALTELGLPTTPDAVRRAEVEGRRRYDASRAPNPGTFSPTSVGDAYFAGTIEALGGSDAQVEAGVSRFLARHAGHGLWSRPVEGARAAIDAVGALRLAVAVVSNSDGRAEQHLIDCGVRAGIDFVVDSHLVGIEKPDPGIFDVALGRLGIPAAHALFVGDIRSLDEEGARAAGTRFVLIDPYGDYAAPETPAIRQIADLPDFILRHFTVTPRRGAPPTSSTPAMEFES